MSDTNGTATDGTTKATTEACVPDRNAERQEAPVDPATGRPYINTVAAVAIAPSGVGSELSGYVAQAVGVIRDSGLPNETNAMFTNIEGDLDAVLKVVRDATMKLAGQGYRTGVTLKLDIRPGFSGQLAEKPALVDHLLDDGESPRR
ncbi:thiamine-binding protein [uncultured Bifidobacterium sp.]|uniref:thiamine-binding protein n=1 Tax=uncultured Bifidobacterium sp. TaxID=165187 RepID=UPI0028DCF265|nr:thiamine-binding protein [uncultured Bifidobacterium sp.]